jgi:hypothetical protein
MPSLGRNQHFLNAKELMNRWGISEPDLLNILSGGEIKFRDASEDLNSYSYDDRMLKLEYIPIMIFELTDVKRFERNNPKYKPPEEPTKKTDPEPLPAKEKRELGQLRNEKMKWDESIKATFHICSFCKDKEDGSVTRDMVRDQIHKYFPQLPETTIDKIWKAIPPNYRNKGGRPRKNRQSKN